ncbi:MAG: iron-sulfur cluster assembly scaffold protein [Christensenellaceae bacterium]
MTDAKFKTFGCAATSPPFTATDMVIGMTVEALKLTNQKVVRSSRAPPQKLHVQFSAEEAIKAAIRITAPNRRGAEEEIPYV